MVAFEMGDLELAKTYFMTATQMNPSFPEAKKNYRQVLIDSGDYEGTDYDCEYTWTDPWHYECKKHIKNHGHFNCSNRYFNKTPCFFNIFRCKLKVVF